MQIDLLLYLNPSLCELLYNFISMIGLRVLLEIKTFSSFFYFIDFFKKLGFQRENKSAVDEFFFKSYHYRWFHKEEIRLQRANIQKTVKKNNFYHYSHIILSKYLKNGILKNNFYHYIYLVISIVKIQHRAMKAMYCAYIQYIHDYV